LIPGAGTGSDTATALAHGVKRITAVEIDPLILRLGAQLHPISHTRSTVRLVTTTGVF
jgi:spermidine synthase